VRTNSYCAPSCIIIRGSIARQGIWCPLIRSISSIIFSLSFLFFCGCSVIWSIPNGSKARARLWHAVDGTSIWGGALFWARELFCRRYCIASFDTGWLWGSINIYWFWLWGCYCCCLDTCIRLIGSGTRVWGCLIRTRVRLFFSNTRLRGVDWWFRWPRRQCTCISACFRGGVWRIWDAGKVDWVRKSPSGKDEN